MSDDVKAAVDAIERITRLRDSLVKAESFIRNGNLIYANREIYNIYKQMEKGEIFDLDDNGISFVDKTIAHKLTSIMFSLKRAVGFLQTIVNADAEMQRALTLAGEIRKNIVDKISVNGETNV